MITEIVPGIMSYEVCNNRNTCFILFPFYGDAAFSEYFCTIIITVMEILYTINSRESTSHVSPFRMVFFYLVTTGWIFDIILLSEMGSSVPRQHAHLHTQAESGAYTYGIPPEFRGGVHLFI